LIASTRISIETLPSRDLVNLDSPSIAGNALRNCAVL
jgi:hypothetical protein